MPNEIHDKYKTLLSNVQASAAAAAGVTSAGTKTEIDQTSGTSGSGCNRGIVTLKVTVAPSSVCYAELLIEGGNSSGSLSAPRVVGIFGNIQTTADTYQVSITDLPKYFELSWRPIGAGFTAALDFMPVVPEIQ